MLELEDWRDVVGYEGWYEVSNMGQVRRIKAGPGARIGRIMRTNTKGRYPFAHLSKNGRNESPKVHRLVLTAFVGPRPEGYECNHKNGDKADNRVENLEWVTHKENVRHSFEVLGRRNPKGQDHGCARLTAQAVGEMRDLWATGKYTQTELGEIFGCDQTNVSLIVNRKTWAHI